MPQEEHVKLGTAIAAALSDACDLWHAETGGRNAVKDDLALHAQRLEVHAQLQVAGPLHLVVEIVDRRPGKSSLFSYTMERAPHKRGLFRKPV